MEVMAMNGELYHHGIKGMHWGIRRYQNEDGSLTDAGKKRYNSEDSMGYKYNKPGESGWIGLGRAIKSKFSPNDNDSSIRRETKKQREWNAKNASQLSDKELTDQILRLQREKQLKDLTDQVVRPGKSHAKDLLKRYGDQALGAVVTAAVTTGVSIGVTKKMNKKWDPQKSAYDRMKEDLDAKTKLADEGMPVNVKGYKRKDGKWVPKD